MNALHLCCGGGGITSGFEMAGIKTGWAVDNQPVVIETHKANFPRAMADVHDLKDIHASDLDFADVWTCGIPCEFYSQAGTRLRDDPVTWQLIRLLQEAHREGVLPDYLFLENVPEYMTSRPAQELREAIDGVGLRFSQAIFSYADFGAPSIRRRWHLIAYPDKTALPWPEQTHMEEQNVLNLPLWVRFGEIREKRVAKPRYMSPKALKGIIRRQRRKAQIGSDKGCGVHKCLYIVEDDDMMFTMMASAWKGLSRNQAVIVPHGHGFREPTELEWRRVQGFPDSFIFEGTKRQRCEQIGRAVPPMMAYAVAKAIMKQQTR